LQGFVDYGNWQKNPEKIQFMRSIDGIKFTLYPMDIIGFSVLDETYKSAIVKTELSLERTDLLTYNKDLKTETVKVFLQAMIEGSKSLYHSVNKIGKEQFYIMQDTSFELLLYKKYLKKQDGKSGIAENTRFKGQLAYYLQDCPTIQSKLTTLEYNKLDMERLFDYYYSNTQTEIDFQKKTEKIRPEFGILAGPSITTLNFTSDYLLYLENTNYGQSINYTAGLFLDLVIPRNKEKLSLCNELIYTSFSFNGETALPYKTTTYYTEFEYTYLKMNNMVRFRSGTGKSFVYFNAGLTNGYALSGTSNFKVGSSAFSNIFDRKRNWESGMLLGLGARIIKYSFEIRFEKGNGMSPYYYTHSNTNRYYFLLGYTF